MIIKKDESMTNQETKALIEAIKIITERSDNLEEIKNALDRIQDALERNP